MAGPRPPLPVGRLHGLAHHNQGGGPSPTHAGIDSPTLTPARWPHLHHAAGRHPRSSRGGWEESSGMESPQAAYWEDDSTWLVQDALSARPCLVLATNRAAKHRAAVHPSLWHLWNRTTCESAVCTALRRRSLKGGVNLREVRPAGRRPAEAAAGRAARSHTSPSSRDASQPCGAPGPAAR
jgi:hypothetical protein